MLNTKLQELQSKLAKENAGWEAGYTPLLELSESERQRLCGAVPPGGPPSDEEKLAAKNASLSAHLHLAGGVGAYPSTFDWRNVNGNNYVTPIRNQGGCGSCVAFGTSASVEIKFRIQRGNPGYPIDLSEAHLFYCLKGDANGCANGWWPTEAFDHYKNTGVARENYFPYVGSQQTCNVANGWQNEKVQITGWREIRDVNAIKDWIANNGPVDACFEVFEDFFAYRSGVYRHSWGQSVGWHCVCIIGYDDINRCWIAKNSWGTGNGDAGYWRIGYGDSSIELYGMRAPEGILDSGWAYNKLVIGLWAINQDYNAWVYLQDEGWRKLFPGNHNVFFDQLTQLTNAKNKGTVVSVRTVNGQIVEIYS